MRADRSIGLSRGGVIVGIVLVVVLGAGLLWLFRPGGPDPGRLLFIEGRSVVARELDSGDERELAELPPDAREVTFAPDGRSLTYVEGIDVFHLSFADGEPVQLTEDGGSPGGFTVDGLPIVLVPTDDDRSQLIVSDGVGERVLLGPGPWALEGEVVWLDRGRFAVRLVDLDANRAGMVVVSTDEGVLHTVPDGTPLAAAADGAELLYAVGTSPEARLSVLSARTFESRSFEFTGTFNDVAVSRAGIPAIAAVDPKGTAGIWILDREARAFELVIEEAERLEWSIDGSTLIYSVDGAVWSRNLSLRRPDRIDDLETKRFTVVP